MAMPVASAMPGHVDQEGDPQQDPFITYDTTWEKKEIRHGRDW